MVMSVLLIYKTSGSRPELGVKFNNQPTRNSNSAHTIYRTALAPVRKPYRMRLLLTHNNCDFRAISVKEQSSRANLESGA